MLIASSNAVAPHVCIAFVCMAPRRKWPPMSDLWDDLRKVIGLVILRIALRKVRKHSTRPEDVISSAEPRK